MRYFGPKAKAKAAPKSRATANTATETPVKSQPAKKEAPKEKLQEYPLIQTQYNLENSLKININLPSLGYTWFFVKPYHTIGDFEKMVSNEDENVIRVDFIKADGSKKHIDDKEVLMDLKDEVYLEIDQSKLDDDGKVLEHRLKTYSF